MTLLKFVSILFLFHTVDLCNEGLRRPTWEDVQRLEGEDQEVDTSLETTPRDYIENIDDIDNEHSMITNKINSNFDASSHGNSLDYGNGLDNFPGDDLDFDPYGNETAMIDDGNQIEENLEYREGKDGFTPRGGLGRTREGEIGVEGKKGAQDDMDNSAVQKTIAHSFIMSLLSALLTLV